MAGLTNNIAQIFGAGDVYCMPTSLTTGLPLTPVKLGTLQDIEIDIKAPMVELFGQNQYPEAVARGQAKLTGKAKIGRFDLNMWNEVFNGGTYTSGTYQKEVINEAHTAGASLPTISPTVSASSYTDLGIYYSANGVQLSLSSAASSIAGTYTFLSSGLWTVSTADTAASSFLINYSYPAATGNQVVVANTKMGQQPVFRMDLYESFNGPLGNTNLTMQLYQCIMTSWTFPFKNNNFNISEIEFEAFANSAGNVYAIGTGT